MQRYCMRTSFGLLFSALLIFITACTPQATPFPVSPRPTITSAAVNSSQSQDKTSQCTYLPKALPTKADETSLFAPVTADEHILGPADAYLTIVIYSDYQCPACAQFSALLTQLQHKHPKDIRIVYRNFPLLTSNNKAAISTQAAEAANLQGKFWEMHDLLYAKQADWLNLTVGKFYDWVTEQAAGLGLDQKKFVNDLTSPQINAIPQRAWDTAIKIPLPGVPFILLNGQIIKWQPTLLNSLETIVNLTLLPERQFSSCPPIVIDRTKEYFANLKTSKGEIIIHLLTAKAPNTVNNFVFLARHGWYDNTSFYRVLPGFVAQAGDPSDTGEGNPGYFIPDEIDQTLKYDRPGVVGMFNSGIDTNGSEFFITFAAAAKLNNQYTIFGEVTKGMDVLNHLTPRDPIPGEMQPDGDALISVTIDEK